MRALSFNKRAVSRLIERVNIPQISLLSRNDKYVRKGFQAEAIGLMRIAELENFGISRSVIEKLTELGYEELTEIQRSAIESGLFENRSLIVSAPTGTGKTFIGELAALTASTRKELGRTFLLVPLKALAEEKFEDFQKKYTEWGLRVAISTADRIEFDNELVEYDVIISTYEKLNALLIRRPELLREIGLVIIDEIQNIGDESRGLSIEVLLTRILIYRSNDRPQIIGLSATISNAKELASWLGAELGETEKRDIELREGILYTGKASIGFLGKKLENGDFIYREFNTGNIEIEPKLEIDEIKKIAEISQNEQSIIFINTQGKTQRIARRIAEGLPSTSDTDELIEELDNRVESTPSTRALKRTLQNGVAFHHAGLLPVEREIVEDGFRRGLIRVVCATTTLGAGVNTPAKNVIIFSHQFWDGRSIPTSDYKNMSGRAGRIRTKDEFGRSILLGESEREMEMLWREYVTAQPERVKSQIPGRRRFDCSILGLVASGVCSTIEELTYFLEMTFFGHTYYRGTSEEFQKYFDVPIKEEISKLINNGFIEEENGDLTVTELGKRCAEELLLPDTILLLYEILKKFEIKIKETIDLNRFVEGFIHLCCCSPDASLLFKPTSEAEIEELRAIWKVNRESFMHEPRDETLFLRSLRTTRMLRRWIDGLSLSELAAYAPHGIIKRTAENISWILNGFARVADKPLFDFSDEFYEFMEMLAGRVYYGVPSEAIPNMQLRIPAIHRHRATLLAEAGFKTIDDLINASMSDLISVRDIGERLALQIKEHVERFIEDETARHRERQIRIAQQLGRSSVIIEQLYNTKGDVFARVCADLLKDHLGLDALYVGDAGEHEPDILVRTPEGNILIESKRKERGNVTAIEAEEILGKGARYTPVTNLTIGFPDFVEEAKKNVAKTKITLLKASVLGEILLQCWQEKLDQEDVISLLKSGKYIRSLYKTKVKDKLK